MVISPEDILRLFLAIVAGGAIGLERELHHKAAGFRTITLICLGSALFTIMDRDLSASARIAANIITGVGFLGAGVILHAENQIKGLTTSASVWVAAAVGMAIGSGAYILATVTVLFILVIMRSFILFERHLDQIWDVRQYHITFLIDSQKFEWIEEELTRCGLKINMGQRIKQNQQLIGLWNVSGSTFQHNQFIASMIGDPEIKEIFW